MICENVMKYTKANKDGSIYAVYHTSPPGGTEVRQIRPASAANPDKGGHPDNLADAKETAV